MFKPRRIVAVVCVTVSSTAVADIINVPGDYPTIQAGINAAQDGDEVVVADGTYTGPGNRNVVFAGKAITLRSENGPTNCIIDCESLGRGFIFYELETPATIVDGFTITNGLGHPGGAIYAYYFSSPTIANCVITGNTGDTGGGGGIYCAMCFATITNTIITGNTAIGDGGGVYSDGGDPTITNSLISGNTADSGGGGVSAYWGSPTITNSTIVGNTAGIVAGGVYFGGETSPTITNSIIWSNGLEEIYVDESSTLVVSYSNVQGGWLGTANIDADPMFVNPINENYRLSSGSPGIDAGNNWGVPIDAKDYDQDGNTGELFPVDLDGNPRFNADKADFDPGCGVPVVVDMGAYEYQFDPVEDVIFADLNADGTVGILDLLGVLAAWGDDDNNCLADLDIDGDVDILDLLTLLANWS